MRRRLQQRAGHVDRHVASESKADRSSRSNRSPLLSARETFSVTRAGSSGTACASAACRRRRAPRDHRIRRPPQERSQDTPPAAEPGTGELRLRETAPEAVRGHEALSDFHLPVSRHRCCRVRLGPDCTVSGVRLCRRDSGCAVFVPVGEDQASGS